MTAAIVGIGRTPFTTGVDTSAAALAAGRSSRLARRGTPRRRGRRRAVRPRGAVGVRPAGRDAPARLHSYGAVPDAPGSAPALVRLAAMAVTQGMARVVVGYTPAPSPGRRSRRTSWRPRAGPSSPAATQGGCAFVVRLAGLGRGGRPRLASMQAAIPSAARHLEAWRRAVATASYGRRARGCTRWPASARRSGRRLLPCPSAALVALVRDDFALAAGAARVNPHAGSLTPPRSTAWTTCSKRCASCAARRGPGAGARVALVVGSPSSRRRRCCSGRRRDAGPARPPHRRSLHAAPLVARGGRPRPRASRLLARSASPARRPGVRRGARHPAAARVRHLRVAHLGSYGRFGVTPRSIRRGIDEVRRALGWTHTLGGDVLVVISGGRDGASWEDAARAYADAYALLLPEAAAAGVRLAIEVIHPSARTCRSSTRWTTRAPSGAAPAGCGGYARRWHSGWERGCSTRFAVMLRGASMLAAGVGNDKRVTMWNDGSAPLAVALLLLARDDPASRRERRPRAWVRDRATTATTSSGWATSACRAGRAPSDASTAGLRRVTEPSTAGRWLAQGRHGRPSGSGADARNAASRNAADQNDWKHWGPRWARRGRRAQAELRERMRDRCLEPLGPSPSNPVCTSISGLGTSTWDQIGNATRAFEALPAARGRLPAADFQLALCHYRRG